MDEKMKTNWQENAEFVKDTFGAYVDWHERYYICPYCGEPIYESDWSEQDLNDYLCPVCEDQDAEFEEDV